MQYNTIQCNSNTLTCSNLIIFSSLLFSSFLFSSLFLSLSQHGNTYLNDLDTTLQTRGAKFDIVDQVSHKELEKLNGKAFSFAEVTPNPNPNPDAYSNPNIYHNPNPNPNLNPNRWWRSRLRWRSPKLPNLHLLRKSKTKSSLLLLRQARALIVDS